MRIQRRERGGGQSSGMFQSLGPGPGSEAADARPYRGCRTSLLASLRLTLRLPLSQCSPPPLRTNSSSRDLEKSLGRIGSLAGAPKENRVVLSEGRKLWGLE